MHSTDHLGRWLPPENLFATWTIAIAIGLLATSQLAAQCDSATETTSRQTPVTAVAWDRLGRSILAATDHRMDVLDATSLQVQRTIPIEMPTVSHLSFSPDGTRLLVVGGDPSHLGCIELFHWPSGERMAFKGRPANASNSDVVTHASWMRDGRGWLQSDWSGLARLQRIDTADTDRLQGSFEGDFTGHSKPILATMLWDRDTLAITAGLDASIKCWRTNDGAWIRSLDNHTEPIVALAAIANPNGASPWLVSASSDKTIRLWDPRIGRLIRFARLDSPPVAMATWPIPIELASVEAQEAHARVWVAMENDALVEVDMISLRIQPIEDPRDDPFEAMLVTPEHPVPIVWRRSGPNRVSTPRANH
jgi:WD40 repeat protein